MIRKHGFTLMEALVSLAIASALLIPISGWLWNNRDHNLAPARLYATGLLQHVLTQCVMKHAVPEFPWRERDMTGGRWVVYFRAETSQKETCVTGLAVRNDRDSLATAVVCYYE